jgi:hypothetical protein
MIKKYNQFIKESSQPGPQSNGSKRVSITDSEMNLFSDEPSLQKLLSDGKVSLLDKEVWYDESDEETRNILDQYLEMPGKV